MRPFVVLAALLAMAIPPASAGVSFVGGRQTHVREQTPTEIPWATPLAGGPVRVLAVAPEFTKYDLVELAKRLEMKWEWLPVHSRDRLTENGDAAAFVTAFRKGVAASDVVVIANIDIAILPAASIQALLERVEQGTGLLLAHTAFTHGASTLAPAGGEDSAFHAALAAIPDMLEPLPGADAAAVTRGLALEITPEWEVNRALLRAGRLGAGRVVAVDSAAGHPLFHSLLPPLQDAFLAEEVYWETYLAMIARAVRWAGRSDPTAQIVAVASTALAGPQEAEIPPDLPPEFIQAMKDSVIQPVLHPFILHLDAPAPRRYSVRARVRIPGREVQLAWPQEQPIQKGDTSYAFLLPVGVGTYFLDVWLYESGRTDRVVDWFSEAVTIDGWPAITQFQSSKSGLAPNDTIQVTVAVPPQLRRMAEPSLAGEILVRATDSLGRVVAEASDVLTGEGGQFMFTLDFVNLPGQRIKLEAFAADRPNDAVVAGALFNTAYDYTYLPVAAPANLPYRFVVQAPAAVEYGMAHLLRALRELGVDSVSAAENTSFAFQASQHNIRLLPQFSALTATGTSPAICPHDADHGERMVETLQGAGRAFATFGVDTFFVSTDTAGQPEHAWAACPMCRAAFQEYLEPQYPGLAALNAAWHAAFARWDGVPFPTEPAARESWAPYVDLQRYHERTLANPYMLSHAAVQQAMPHARAGAVLPAAHAGGPLRDLWLFASQLHTTLCVADPVAAEKLRSYRMPQGFAAVAYRADALDAGNGFARWLPWHGVAHGMSALWLTDAIAGSERGGQRPLLTAELEPRAALEELGAQMREVQAGFATLLAAATRESYGIAIYDSAASGHVNDVMKDWYESRVESESVFMKMIESLGYQYDFVADALGPRGLSEYRVLILPAVWALSDAEIAAITAFRASGGIIIADALPGIYDEHGQPRDAAPLATLFNLVHAGGTYLEEKSNAAVALTLGEDALDATLVQTAHDARVSRPGDEAPAAVLWHLHDGVSMALLLNHPVTAATMPQARDALDFVLREAGFVPAARPELPKGQAFDGEVVYWNAGPARIVALLRDPGPARKQKVSPRLRLDGRLYDMRTGARIRKPEKLQVNMAPGDAALYAALPYEVNRVELIPTAADLPAGRPLRVSVEIKTQGGLPGRHLVWVELIGPDGEALRHYGQAVWCDGGRGQASIALALNEKPGLYTLRARDVLSGVRAEQAVRILPR
jgi:hypothetical protein